MAQALCTQYTGAQARMDAATSILGFDIWNIMFSGTAEDLARTSVTQPAIFLHSVLLAEALNAASTASMGAGHSLGEFSALVAAGSLSFEDGLSLVARRAAAMQAACDAQPSTMAAIVGLDDAVVEKLCADAAAQTGLVVAPANYNSPGQLVISGAEEAIHVAVEAAKAAGARMAKVLQVNGAFHSALMQPAREKLATAIAATAFRKPAFPVYQNVNARPEIDPARIQQNLIDQLTAPVRWTATLQNMHAAGARSFVELGPGKVLAGLVKRTLTDAEAASLDTLPA